MADHAPGAAIYVIKAIRAASNPADTESAVAEEHRWQIEQLPAAIREFALDLRREIRFYAIARKLILTLFDPLPSAFSRLKLCYTTPDAPLQHGRTL